MVYRDRQFHHKQGAMPVEMRE